MIPDIETRLDSMRRAMLEVVIPAIDPHKSLAVEQAMLVIAQLSMLDGQVSKIDIFTNICLSDLKNTLEKLEVDGGPASISARTEIANILSGSLSGASEAYRNLGNAAEALIRAMDKDGTESSREHVHIAMLNFSKRQAMRDRIWFAASGFDPSAAILPTIDDMIKSSREKKHGS